MTDARRPKNAMIALTAVAGMILSASPAAWAGTASSADGRVTGRLVNNGRVPKHSNVVEILRAGHVLSRRTVGKSGRFQFREPAGTYRVRSNRGCGVTVKIVSGGTVNKTIFCVFH